MVGLCTLLALNSIHATGSSLYRWRLVLAFSSSVSLCTFSEPSQDCVYSEPYGKVHEFRAENPVGLTFIPGPVYISLAHIHGLFTIDPTSPSNWTRGEKKRNDGSSRSHRSIVTPGTLGLLVRRGFMHVDRMDILDTTCAVVLGITRPVIMWHANPSSSYVSCPPETEPLEAKPCAASPPVW